MRQAINEVLDKIGPSFKQVIIEGLEDEGISLVSPCSSLEDIEKALRGHFGYDGAQLLVQAVRRQLKYE